MDLSIIILSFNNLFKLRLVLKYLSLQQEVDQYSIEVIVIDDCSMEDIGLGIKDIIVTNKLFKNIRIIKNATNMGSAKSRNIGVLHSCGEIILFLDNDIILSPITVKSHMDYYQQSCDMTISRIFDISRKNYESVVKKLEEMTQLDESIFEKNIETEMDPFFEIRETILQSENVSKNSIWSFGTFCCASIKKDIFNKLGGFDKNFVGWGPEDIDLSYRLYKAGYTIEYCSKAVCYHMDNNSKDINILVKDISKNLKYISKKFSNKEIESYLKFYKGSISYEEFDAFMNENKYEFDEIKGEHKIGILKFINFKTKYIKNRGDYTEDS